MFLPSDNDTGTDPVDNKAKTVTLYHTILTCNDSQERSLWKTLWEKEKMLVTSIFSFSQNVFYPVKDRYHYLNYINFVVCKCFQFGHIQNFVVW